MGMREHPCSGYTIPLSALYRVLPELEEVVDEGILDQEDLKEWLVERWRPEWPAILDLFSLSDEDTPGEEMVRSQYYVLLDEDELYETCPTEKLRRWRSEGISPVFSTWSIWG